VPEFRRRRSDNLILLVVYIMATIGMTRLVFFSGQTAVRRWEIVIPVLGIIVLGYTLFRNVWPLPTGVNWWVRPWPSAGWWSASPGCWRGPRPPGGPVRR
jgi:hypothetical protein